MRKTWVTALAMALIGCAGARAEEMKPLAVVSLASFERVEKNVELIGQIADNQQLRPTMDLLIMMATQQKGLAGLDKTRPAGVIVQSDGQAIAPIAFLPVTDLTAFLDALEGAVGKAEKQGDVYNLTINEAPVVAKQQGKWVFVARGAAEQLANVPADPAAALGDLPAKYDLGVRLLARNIPESFRMILQMLLQQGSQEQLKEPMPGESDAAFQKRKEVTEKSMQQVVQQINDIDELTLGLKFDAAAKNAALDFVFLVKEGSQLARNIAGVKALPSKMANLLLPTATFNMAGAGTQEVDPSASAQLEATLDSARQAIAAKLAESDQISEESRKVLKQAGDDAIDVLLATAKSGRSDMGLAVVLDVKKLLVVGGSYIAQSDKLEGALKRVVQQMNKEEPQVGSYVKLDAATVDGVRLHTAEIPTSLMGEDSAELADLVGDTLELCIGFGNEQIFFGLGRDAVKAVKEAVAAAGGQSQEIPPAKASLKIAPIARMIAEYGDEDGSEGAKRVADFLKKSGKDEVRLVADYTARGVRVRMTLEEGILSLIGNAQKLAGPQP